MTLASKIAGTAQAWEDEQLGADAAHAKVAPEHEDEIDAALGLQPISIRLNKGLIESLKALGQLNGIGYQPLVRQILTRFVDCEMKNLLKQRVAEQEASLKPTLKATPAKTSSSRKQPEIGQGTTGKASARKSMPSKEKMAA